MAQKWAIQGKNHKMDKLDIDIINKIFTSKNSEYIILMLMAKNNEKLLKQLIDNHKYNEPLNYWSFDESLMKKLLNYSDEIRTSIIVCLISSSSEALIQYEFNKKTVELVYNMLMRTPLYMLYSGNMKYVINLFRINNLNISRFENIPDEYNKNPYAYDTNPILQEKQLELFSSFKLSARQK